MNNFNFILDTSPSPFGGQLYGSNLSPMYNPQGGTSPQQQYIFPNHENLPGRTPSPNYNFSPQAQNYASVTPPLNIQNNMSPSLPMPHMSEGISNYFNTQQNWATPNAVQSVGTSVNVIQFDATNAMQVETTPTGLSSVLDLDSKELKELNSAELAGLNLLDANLSENLTYNLSLNDVGQESMTDSFTRLTTATINNICNLNDIYKPNIKE